MPPINTWERRDFPNGTISLFTFDIDRSMTIYDECWQGEHRWIIRILDRSGRSSIYWSQSLLSMVRYVRRLYKS